MTAADLASIVTDTRDGAAVQIRVIPRAGRSQVAGVRDRALLLRIAAAPVDGAANGAVLDLLARAFGVPRRAISILSGARSRDKRIVIAGLDAGAVRRRLESLIA